MKKQIVLCLAVLLLGMTGSGRATSYTESYDGYQAVYENRSYTFGFDLGNKNSNSVSTTSSLALTSDEAIDPLETWNTLSLGITFWSSDSQGESAKISVLSTGWQDLATVDFEAGYWQGTYVGESYEYEGIFSDDLMADLQSLGTLKIRIKAPHDKDRNNNFTIKSVSLTVNTQSQPAPSPVPEPATILLLGAGLAGLARIKKAGILF